MSNSAEDPVVTCGSTRSRLDEVASIRRLFGSTSATNRATPALPGRRGEVLEQHRPEAAALVGVLRCERDLGRLRGTRS